jgi:hypothetical protein
MLLKAGTGYRGTGRIKNQVISQEINIFNIQEDSRRSNDLVPPTGEVM